MPGKNNDKIRCSFCNKTEDQVHKLIAGPNGVYICDECVEICSEIIEEEMDEEYAPDGEYAINLQKPMEIKDFWMNMSSDRMKRKKRWRWLCTITTSVS